MIHFLYTLLLLLWHMYFIFCCCIFFIYFLFVYYILLVVIIICITFVKLRKCRRMLKSKAQRVCVHQRIALYKSYLLLLLLADCTLHSCLYRCAGRPARTPLWRSICQDSKASPPTSISLPPPPTPELSPLSQE